jgi:intraflagellar transport protein 88
MNLFQQALDLYESIHEKNPDNIECLRYLVTICKDLGKKEYYEYSKKLGKLERFQDGRTGMMGGMTQAQGYDDMGGAQNQTYNEPGYGEGYGQQQIQMQQPEKRYVQQKEDNDDDWGDDGDVDALLPS